MSDEQNNLAQKVHSEITKYYDSNINKILYGISILLMYIATQKNVLIGDSDTLKLFYLMSSIITIVSYLFFIISWRISQIGGYKIMNEEITNDKIKKYNKHIRYCNNIFSYTVILLILIFGFGVIWYVVFL